MITGQTRTHSGGPRTGGSARPAFTAKGHDAILKRLQDGKEDVIVVMISGDRIAGKIIARDKFTITLNVKDDEEGSEKEVDVTLYKHAIESFFKSVAQ